MSQLIHTNNAPGQLNKTYTVTCISKKSADCDIFHHIYTLKNSWLFQDEIIVRKIIFELTKNILLEIAG